MSSARFSARNPTRVERLLRERELWQLSRPFDDGAASDADLFENEIGLFETDEEVGSTSNSSYTTVGDGFFNADGAPLRQRLLIAVNRLPVSANCQNGVRGRIGRGGGGGRGVGVGPTSFSFSILHRCSSSSFPSILTVGALHSSPLPSPSLLLSVLFSFFFPFFFWLNRKGR